MCSSDPAEIKHLGEQINMDEDQESSWFAKKDDVMRSGLAAKFDQNKDLGKYLKTTGNRRLVEASGDRYWGAGRKLKDPLVFQSSKWSGKNNLGRLLESIRKDIK